MLVESAPACFSNDVLGQPQRICKAKHVDLQNLWIQEASKSARFVTKKVGTSVNPADLMTKPLPKPKIEQVTSSQRSRRECRSVVQRWVDGTTWVTASG